MARSYYPKKIRDLLIGGFTSKELRQFCFYEDAFRPVYDNLPQAAGKTDIADEIIEFAAARTRLFEPLLAWARENNPFLYDSAGPYYTEEAAPPVRSDESSQAAPVQPGGGTAFEPVRTYYTYRIRVANAEGVKVEKRNDRNEVLGEPAGMLRYSQYRGEIQALAAAARAKAPALTEAQVQALGELLFKALFEERLGQDFANLYEHVVHGEGKLLRVELDVDEQALPELAALPWEFMCLPAELNLGIVWLATAPDLIFSRRRQQWFLPRRLQLQPGEKLRLGLAVAAPADLGKVVYAPVMKELARLAEEQAAWVELLPVVEEANPEALDRLLAKRPHLLHFIGHGQFKDEQGVEVGQLALVDNLGRARWVTGKYFGNLLNRYRPGVVLLQACEGGVLSAAQAFVGVASQVVAQNIPVVVAMQYEVSNSTASRFARRFYERLAAGDPVDRAAQDGRWAITLETDGYATRDFATPVIFMRAADGYLFDRRS